MSAIFYVPIAANYNWRFGADVGLGGAMFIDGVVVAYNWFDMWWAGSWANTAQSLQTNVALSVGYHSIEIFGAEDCCDGAQGF